MRKKMNEINIAFERFLTRLGLGMRAKLILIFLLVKVVPLIILTAIAWQQIVVLGDELRKIAVEDSSAALNESAVENIERMTTDTAQSVAKFLYQRDDDILYLAGLEPSEEAYRQFLEAKQGRVVRAGEWVLAEDGASWVPATAARQAGQAGKSSNVENEDMDGFHAIPSATLEYDSISLYDEITFVDLEGNEQVKVVAEDSTKVNYPMSPVLRDVSKRENTYVKAETYFEQVQNMQPGDIYVSDVLGAYVGSNYIGMYTPDVVAAAAEERGYDIPYTPESQAYAGKENPNGQRFEGIVRWATPVTGEEGEVIGYVTFALNHDHIMEFVDHITPMNERYTQLPSAFEGNYAFIWDYNCRSICHPRHHSIVGIDPETGNEQIPWLETSIYDAWQQSGVEEWTEFIVGWPTFDGQSREKKPAPALTQQGFVGLDGRYLNNAPQCTGWMDLTRDGGSGSFYILWSGLYKLTTAGAIPYYTGQYAPGAANGYSLRGFGIVTIGAGLEDFTRPATETEERLTQAIQANRSDTSMKLIITSIIIITLVVLIAIWIASSLTGNITRLNKGISRFRAGQRQYRFNAPVKDEFGNLADAFDDMADSIVASVKDPMSIIDHERRIIYMNDEGLVFCQKTLDEVVGSLYSDTSIYPANTKYDPITALEEGRESEIYFDENSGRYLRGTASHFEDKDGENIGYIITTGDVTEMVLEQLKIEEQKSLLDKIFASSPDLIWYMDTRGVYVTVNPRFASIAGQAPEEFVGKTAAEMLPDEIARIFRENDEAALSSKKPQYAEEKVTFSSGQEETLDSVRTPIFDATGALVGLLGFARNVSFRVTIENELRQTQLELEDAVNEANRANEHKGEFLARMSHEIRTPMNAIIGLANILHSRLDDMDDAGGRINEVKGHVQQIEASSQHLLGLLNDILDISKIEAGKIDLSEEAVELPRLAATVAGIIKPRCDEKNISFLTKFEEFTPHTFLSDPLRLRQVLINLLGNAVKFTPECGEVEFSIQKKDRRAGETLVEFTVRDNGIGISDEARQTIFQPFEQGGSQVTQRYGGTGLGLAISRNIVQLLGGEITLESAPGAGSTFRFSLWLRETEAPAAAELAEADMTGIFTGKKLLLVDDVEINRVIVLSMLEDTGLQIDEADDGVSALAAFKQSAPGEYDIIFMDVQMPNMNGYDAAMAIRALDRPDAASVPIIALTANAFKDDIDKALQFGMDAHIAKPIEMDTLGEVLLRYLGGRRG